MSMTPLRCDWLESTMLPSFTTIAKLNKEGVYCTRYLCVLSIYGGVWLTKSLKIVLILLSSVYKASICLIFVKNTVHYLGGTPQWKRGLIRRNNFVCRHISLYCWCLLCRDKELKICLLYVMCKIILGVYSWYRYKESHLTKSKRGEKAHERVSLRTGKMCILFFLKSTSTKDEKKSHYSVSLKVV